MQKDFSYPLQIDELGSGEQSYKLVATNEELEFLTEVLKLPAVHSFEALIKLKFHKRQSKLIVQGAVKSCVSHVSVISLEPFDKEYCSEFNLIYDTEASYEDVKELDVDIMADVPDVVVDGRINLADIAIEQLALVLDDYPRKEGEEFEAVIEDISPIVNNPFAILETLKKK
ncbi:MAG: hypothetical protein IKW58_00840 [Alphaproteobacteria bacterium]|nr:hypothetical protein [Alphaproteobacteria bacterium]